MTPFDHTTIFQACLLDNLDSENSNFGISFQKIGKIKKTSLLCCKMDQISIIIILCTIIKRVKNKNLARFSPKIW